MPDTGHRYSARVIDQRPLSSTGYELILERQGLPFDAGRLITIHGRELTEDRSYTIASGERDEHLHVLYRLIPHGVLTPQLVRLQRDDRIDMSGPFGQFTLRDPGAPIVFIATGTGVAPCRAYIRTHPELDLTLIHGVRLAEDLFYRKEFERYDYRPCVTGEPGCGYRGRVTDYLRGGFDIRPDAHYYLCGAYEMIYDVQALLTESGVDPARVFIEGYYYRLDT